MYDIGKADSVVIAEVVGMNSEDLRMTVVELVIAVFVLMDFWKASPQQALVDALVGMLVEARADVLEVLVELNTQQSSSHLIPRLLEQNPHSSFSASFSSSLSCAFWNVSPLPSSFCLPQLAFQEVAAFPAASFVAVRDVVWQFALTFDLEPSFVLVQYVFAALQTFCGDALPLLFSSLRFLFSAFLSVPWIAFGVFVTSFRFYASFDAFSLFSFGFAFPNFLLLSILFASVVPVFPCTL